eukprot:2538554-Amphidinium_carterae.3
MPLPLDHSPETIHRARPGCDPWPWREECETGAINSAELARRSDDDLVAGSDRAEPCQPFHLAGAIRSDTVCQGGEDSGGLAIESRRTKSRRQSGKRLGGGEKKVSPAPAHECKLAGGHFPSESALAMMEKEIEEKREALVVMSDEQLLGHLRGLMMEKRAPFNSARQNVGIAPKSILLGLYTKRGLGVGKHTFRWLDVMIAAQEWATRRPGPHAGHGYTSIMINANPSLDSRQAEGNWGLNYVYGLPAKGTGGHLWLALDAECQPSRVHPAGDFPIDTDWLVSASPTRGLNGDILRRITAKQAGLCQVEGERQNDATSSEAALGALAPMLGHWQVFDARRPHAVLAFTPDSPTEQRLSLTLKILYSQAPAAWDERIHLSPAGHPRTAADYDGGLTTRRKSGQPRGGRARSAEGGTQHARPWKQVLSSVAAAASGSGSGLPLDCCWASAVMDSVPTAFSLFFRDSLQRKRISSLAKSSPADGDFTTTSHGLYPCGLPFWDSMMCGAGSPPISGRRLQRWRRTRRIHAMVNSAVGYLSWLSLGRPAKWSADERHPLHAELNEEQKHMCMELVFLFSSVCRPSDTFVDPGGGLRHFTE